MKKVFLFVGVVLFLSSFVFAAVDQTVDGRVYYDNGSLVEVGPGFPVLWYLSPEKPFKIKC